MNKSHTRRSLTVLPFCLLGLGALAWAGTVQTDPPDKIATPSAPVPTPVIELAVCLDTSGSMEGLIDSAKQKLWAVVNDLALAQPTPRLRVAVLTFGNDNHKPENGWVDVKTPFTEDLDLVSEKLFELTLDGGTEYVGRVLSVSGQLDWTDSDDTLKLVVLAGNESADQDRQTPYPETCRSLITRGIMINSIYCGPATDDLATEWRDVAQRADGHFATIDQDAGTVVVETPFDQRITDLSVSMNQTYLPYGASGQTAWQNQTTQDANAASLGQAAAASRGCAKSTALYRCGTWDLVDQSKEDAFKLEELVVEDLPEVMRDMTLEQRRAHIDKMGRERTEIQNQVQQLSKKRQLFVHEQMKSQALDDSRAFDVVLRNAVRQQAAAKGFIFADLSGDVAALPD